MQNEDNPSKPQPLSVPERTAFISLFGLVQRYGHNINVSNGFWKPIEALQTLAYKHGLGDTASIHLGLSRLCLITTETSEAAEALRKDHPSTHGSLVKDSLVRELAGQIVRIFDYAEHEGLPLAEAILAELDHNASRPQMHGGKKA